MRLTQLCTHQLLHPGGLRASIFSSVGRGDNSTRSPTQVHPLRAVEMVSEGRRVKPWPRAGSVNGAGSHPVYAELPPPTRGPPTWGGPPQTVTRQDQRRAARAAGASPGKMKMKKELMPPMMPMISPRSGRNRAKASVPVTHRTVSGIRTHGPEGSTRARGPQAQQQPLLQKSCSTDLEATPRRDSRAPGGCSPAPGPPPPRWPGVPPHHPTRWAGQGHTGAQVSPELASPPQEEHDGVDGHDGDGEEDPGDNDDPVAAGVGHQDVSRNFRPEGQEAVKACE